MHLRRRPGGRNVRVVLHQYIHVALECRAGDRTFRDFVPPAQYGVFYTGLVKRLEKIHRRCHPDANGTARLAPLPPAVQQVSHARGRDDGSD